MTKKIWDSGPTLHQFLQLSLQYPDFALGILLFGNFVFALSRWPVLGALGLGSCREALKGQPPFQSQLSQGVSLLLRLSLVPDVAALHGAGGWCGVAR